MDTFKQMLQLSAKQKLELSKEGVEYIASIIPPAVSRISPDTPPEVAAIFATAIKLTCIKIIDKALDFLDEGADIRDIEDVDWRANYFDKCQLVHDDEMQTLWAKILAGEANNPGTYSKRSVNFVADMNKTDAELFTELCRYVCKIKFTTQGIEKIEFVPLIFDRYLLPLRPGYSSDTVPSYHIRTPDLDHLDNIGLIRFAEQKNDHSQETIEGDGSIIDGSIEVSYYGESVCLSQYEENKVRMADSPVFSPPIGRVKLTQIGEELYPICGSTPIDGFFSHICHREWLPFIKGVDDATAKEMHRSYKRTWR